MLITELALLLVGDLSGLGLEADVEDGDEVFELGVNCWRPVTAFVRAVTAWLRLMLAAAFEDDVSEAAAVTFVASCWIAVVSSPTVAAPSMADTSCCSALAMDDCDAGVVLGLELQPETMMLKAATATSANLLRDTGDPFVRRWFAELYCSAVLACGLSGERCATRSWVGTTPSTKRNGCLI